MEVSKKVLKTLLREKLKELIAKAENLKAKKQITVE